MNVIDDRAKVMQNATNIILVPADKLMAHDELDQFRRLTHGQRTESRSQRVESAPGTLQLQRSDQFVKPIADAINARGFCDTALVFFDHIAGDEPPRLGKKSVVRKIRRSRFRPNGNRGVDRLQRFRPKRYPSVDSCFRARQMDHLRFAVDVTLAQGGEIAASHSAIDRQENRGLHYGVGFAYELAKFFCCPARFSVYVAGSVLGVPSHLGGCLFECTAISRQAVDQLGFVHRPIEHRPHADDVTVERSRTTSQGHAPPLGEVGFGQRVGRSIPADTIAERRALSPVHREDDRPDFTIGQAFALLGYESVVDIADGRGLRCVAPFDHHPSLNARPFSQGVAGVRAEGNLLSFELFAPVTPAVPEQGEVGIRLFGLFCCGCGIGCAGRRNSVGHAAHNNDFSIGFSRYFATFANMENPNTHNPLVVRSNRTRPITENADFSAENGGGNGVSSLPDQTVATSPNATRNTQTKPVKGVVTGVGKNACVTYFIQSVHGGNIKIGKATNVKSRLGGLQTGSPSKLVLLGTLKGNQEAALHAKFSASRVHGEWFSPSPEIAAFLKRKFGTDPASLISSTELEEWLGRLARERHAGVFIANDKADLSQITGTPTECTPDDEPDDQSEDEFVDDDCGCDGCAAREAFEDLTANERILGYAWRDHDAMLAAFIEDPGSPHMSAVILEDLCGTFSQCDQAGISLVVTFFTRAGDVRDGDLFQFFCNEMARIRDFDAARRSHDMIVAARAGEGEATR